MCVFTIFIAKKWGLLVVNEYNIESVCFRTSSFIKEENQF